MLTPDLTPRQRRILDFIRETVERRGYPPTVREIGEAVGLVSPSSVDYQLGVLRRKATFPMRNCCHLLVKSPRCNWWR